MDRVEMDDGRAFLIATPEKALADVLVADRRGPIRSRREMSAFLSESWRIEESRLKEMNRNLLEELARRYRSRKVLLLASIVDRLQRGGKR